MIDILDQVVIAGGEPPRSRALTGLQLLPNGELLVGYREGSDHLTTDDGAIMTVRSADGGRTWGEPHSVIAIPGWDCAGGRSIVQTPGGDLLMYVFQARRSGRKPEVHVRPTISTDLGHTWGPFGPDLELFSGWTEPNTCGHIQMLSNGRWMMPAYGADTIVGVSNPRGPASDGSTSYSIVAFSDDQGRSWGEKAVVARHPSINFHEQAVVILADGRFLAVVRTQDAPFTSFKLYSGDEGATWSTPEALPFAGQTPFLIEVDGGDILCAYRDRDPDRLGVSVSITRDDGDTWEFAGQLYEGTDWNCGYPGLVTLPGGDLFCAYYSCYDGRGNSEVQGVRFRVR